MQKGVLEFILGGFIVFDLGVYQVNIDSDQQKVTVQGSVDSANLVKKLLRAGKHAEVWSQKTNQTQKQKPPCIKDDKNNKGKKQNTTKGIEPLKDEDDGEGDDEDEGDKMQQLIRNKMNHLAHLKQQAEANSKKGNANAATSNGNGNNNGRNGGGKKGNQDQKAFAAMKMMNNEHQQQQQQHFGGLNINNDAKRANDISAMMNLAGFNGNVGMLGGNSASPMMMNLHNRHGFQQQVPQMMYNRSPFVQPSTGYYYNYGYGLPDHGHGYGGQHSSDHMFSDDNTSSCSIM